MWSGSVLIFDLCLFLCVSIRKKKKKGNPLVDLLWTRAEKGRQWGASITLAPGGLQHHLAATLRRRMNTEEKILCLVRCKRGFHCLIRTGIESHRTLSAPWTEPRQTAPFFPGCLQPTVPRNFMFHTHHVHHPGFTLSAWTPVIPPSASEP